jgi:hypothetical protein
MGNYVSALLKSPDKITEKIAESDKDLFKLAFQLLASSIFCHAIFGIAVGLFSGTDVALMDFFKAPLIATCSLMLCFPSLYIFTCIAGCPLSISQTFALGCSCLAMLGFLLIGLAPIVWLFAVSTENLPFIVLLILFIWSLAVYFTNSYVRSLKNNPLFSRLGGIKIWFLIFVIVSLQMTTYLRPMLSKPENGWWANGKMFFIEHFNSLM